ncbi:MAG: hypothetical protein JSV36_19695 [Anaerolineae bacterium]|nr:MAG: hypothetical protein JSV36_19695 [Anaerolineae bacterium]
MRLKPEVSPEQVRQIEEGEFTTADILAIIWTTISKLRDKPSVILWSSYLLLALWGFHGDMAILSRAFGEGWTSKITCGLAWGELLFSFIAGFLLMVVIPCLLIKFVFKERIRDYGLGLPEKDQRHKAWVAFFSLFAISSVFVVAGAFDASMQAEYPLFAKGGQGAGLDTITRW